MATPSKKSPGIEKLLEDMSGRTTAIRNNVCLSPPMGCGGPAVDFFGDGLSRKEYIISGLCQKCQDEVFE